MSFREKLFSRNGLPAAAAEELLQYAERIEAGKKQLIVEEGCRDDYTYFVEQGSVRTYVMREERCIIISFALEGDAATSALGAPAHETAAYYVETMEPSILLRIPRRRMDELFAASTELANWGRRVAENMLRTHEEYFADYSWREKRAQYKLILREYPELLQRVPLKDLAAYLFVTPQTLSRIRAEKR